MSPDRLPPDYHQLLFPSEPEPPFLDPAELEHVWGAAWGSHDEVGPLRSVLVRPPGDALATIRGDTWDPAVQALVDPARRWYWTDPVPPDLELLAAQHRGLVDALEDSGAQVVSLPPLPAPFTKAMYVRDPLISVPGGVVVGRMAPRMRRGEEADVTRAVATLGLPILATITGTGTLEGGSFLKLTPSLAAFGTSVRCNDAAAEQLREILARLGVELLVVPLAGFSIHLDLHLLMLDADKALVDAAGLPHWLPGRLRENGIEPLWPDPREPWALNALTVSPGSVLMADECPRTAELLAARGITVRTIPYGEIHKNGGGIHCSTNELLRDPA
jgi:N-dimethylarginine dimethylaminohydrolase